MKTTFFTLASLASTAFSLALPVTKRGGSISVTPHDQFSSSIGVLGCKVNTNRIAYFPGFPSCGGMCIKVSANGRSVNLLHVDTSGGAYDISYDAWNYLKTGQSATADPVAGGGFPATYESVDMSQCEDLLHDSNGKLAFTAANAVGYVVGCGANSWVGKNSALYNIQDMACTMGVDEVCHMPPSSEGNQPVCPSTLGSKAKLAGEQVWNIMYPTGKKQVAA